MQASLRSGEKRFYLYSNSSRPPIAADETTKLPTILGVKPEPWLSAAPKRAAPAQARADPQMAAPIKEGTPAEADVKERAEYWRAQRQLLRQKSITASTSAQIPAWHGNKKEDHPAGRRLASELAHPAGTNAHPASTDVAAMRQALTRQLLGKLDKPARTPSVTKG